ncbi:MAG: hypothetical protein GX221_04360 [Candidatus Riflebacteria bacterium]|nr:hypothetical protein [Candidatus Riflebacteria bacterium]
MRNSLLKTVSRSLGRVAKDFETAPGKTILGTNSIIEWAFDRSFGKFSKLESGKPFLTSDYYGLTLGPRTHEVFSPE